MVGTDNLIAFDIGTPEGFGLYLRCRHLPLHRFRVISVSDCVFCWSEPLRFSSFLPSALSSPCDRGSGGWLEAITRIRWGATRHSINGIPTGTDFMMMIGDGRKTINMTIRNSKVYGNLVDRIWRARHPSSGADRRRTEGRSRDSGVSLIRHKMFRANERVQPSLA
jgi:hypothetical protein